MSTLIADHSYRPDRQGQWVTGRCDKCGEPKGAHRDPASYEQGWADGYGQGRDDEADGLPLRTRVEP